MSKNKELLNRLNYRAYILSADLIKAHGADFPEEVCDE